MFIKAITYCPVGRLKIAKKSLKTRLVCRISPFWGLGKKERGPEPRPLLQATILFHLRGRLMKS